MYSYDKQFLARLMLKKYATADLPAVEVMTLEKKALNPAETKALAKELVKEMKDKLPQHSLWKTLGLAAAIGAGGMVAEHGISSAYHAYKKHQAYKKLAAKYPKLRTAKGREAFEALAAMAPEVAYTPIMAGPILQRGLAYGDEMGLPSVIMDTHSKIKPRKRTEASSWITAVSKAQTLG